MKQGKRCLDLSTLTSSLIARNLSVHQLRYEGGTVQSVLVLIVFDFDGKGRSNFSRTDLSTSHPALIVDLLQPGMGFCHVQGARAELDLSGYGATQKEHADYSISSAPSFSISDYSLIHIHATCNDFKVVFSGC